MVSRRTGLTAHVILILEKRYGAVQPEWTSTHRRHYSEAQVQRPGLLRDLAHPCCTHDELRKPAKKLKR